MKAKFWMVSLAAAAVLSLSCSSKSTNPGGGGNPPPSGNNITIGDNFFNPSSKTVTVGTTITWTYNGIGQHTVTSDAPSTELNSPTITSSNKTYMHTFNVADTFDYHCSFHGGMNGTVIVQ